MEAESPTSAEQALIEVLSTPQPQHAILHSHTEIGGGLSPTSSMAVGNPSSPTKYSYGLDTFPATRNKDRMRYSSPPPPSSSMTPPPSSQGPKRIVPDSPPAGGETPTPSVLSSPPPTVANGVSKEGSNGFLTVLPTFEQIEEALPAKLKELALAMVNQIQILELDLREARMSAAHHKLQYNLLSIETEEAAKRQEVEHDMTRREVQILQMAEQARSDTNPPVSSATSRLIAELKAHCEALNNENTLLTRRLNKAKKIIEQKDDEMEDLLGKNRLYLDRIRANREHLNLLRSPGGLYAAVTPRSSSVFPVTPQQYRSTPKQTPHAMRQDHDSQDSFAALLLADRVLNQENASAPSTPTMSRPVQRIHTRHHRGAQSLSSLPSTPVRSRPLTENGTLLPSVQFAPQSEPRYRTQPEFFVQPTERSRKSRDSTISAEDAEEIAAYNQSEDEDVPESQASQTATEMLRIDPRESMEVVGSPAPSTIVPETSGLLQAKIFGTISKPGLEKRKRIDDSADIVAKKMRTSEASVGLGIGGWA